MAQVSNKRRKVEHVPSSDDDGDDASFASFGDEEGDEEDQEVKRKVVSDGKTSSVGNAGNAQQSNGSANGTATPQPDANRRRGQKSDMSLEQSAMSSGNFKNNVFKLQVDELLTQVRPRSGRLESEAETALRTLKTTIEQLPSTAPLALEQAERNLLKHKVAVPFSDPRPPGDAKYKFAYEKPSSINVVGSFALKGTPRSAAHGVEIDMIVTMPASLFEEKDYLNHRYFYKRAFYLASIAAGLKAAHKQDYKLQFRLFQGDTLKPIIVVAPVESTASDKPASKWRVNIIPCTGPEQFAAEKLYLEKNCIRSAATTVGAEPEGQNAPTSYYNSSLRADMLMASYLKVLHSARKSCEAFTDACLLGGTWLRQRGFVSSVDEGGFGNFEWSALLALCLQGGGTAGKPLLSDRYTSYQLFKATLQLLAVKDFVKAPLTFGQSSASSLQAQEGCPVVWDGSRSHNLFYKLIPSSYRLLRHEAKLTLAALGDGMHDGFEATFIHRVNEPLLRFDHYIQIPSASIASDRQKQERRGVLLELNSILTTGLNDRLRQLSLAQTASSAWALGSSRTQTPANSVVTIGVIVNNTNARRTVDHGPSAENKTEGVAFRNFWGEKAELRRFRDGSILESLVWTPPSECGQSVVEQVVRYLLGRHIGVEAAEAAAFVDHGFEQYVKGGTEQTVFANLMESFKRFENDIRGLEELPLSIRFLSPADPQLRYASLQPPLLGKGYRRPEPANVMLQFEGSARWPDDLVAIQRTKIGFLLKIRELLEGAVDAVTARVGLENEEDDVLNQAFLDVTYDHATTFRVRVYHDREQTLLERRLKDKSFDPRTKEIAATGLAKYKRDYIKSPAHTQAVVRLCSRHPSLGGTMRLAKRWFQSHMLTNHIDEEIIELLCIRTFVHSHPWSAPSSVQSGFLRTLFWISRWDWRAEPLVVDLTDNHEMKPADLQAITVRFEAWRKLDPAMHRVALFVATNLDHDGNTWTDGRPAMVVAGRMTALAKAAIAEIVDRTAELEPASLFSSPLSDFNFVLHLDRLACRGAGKSTASASGGFKNLELAALDDASSLAYDPAQDLLHDLEEAYGPAVVFFRGGEADQPVIAGLWRPQTAPRGWKVNLAYSTVPMQGAGDEEVQAVLNKKAILAEMGRLGGDLVERIEVFDQAI